jgi:hypothetical protein
MEAIHQTEISLPNVDLRARSLFIGLLAGFGAGVLNAVVARLLMRAIALLMFGQGSFSIGGTAVIFMFGALVGPLFGVIYSFTLYRLGAHDLIKGLLFGLVLMFTLQVPGLFLAPDFLAELMAVGPLAFAIFALMNFSYVLTLAWLVGWLQRNWPLDPARQRLERITTTILGLMALVGLVLLLVEIVGRPLGLID